MLARPPRFGRTVVADKRDSDDAVEEAERAGEVGSAGKGADTTRTRYVEAHTAAIGRNLAGLPLPTPGRPLLLVSEKDVNAFSLLLWILDRVGHAEDLFVSTFNVNEAISKAFAGLLDDGRVGSLSLVLSQSAESRVPKRIAELYALWSDRADRWRVALCWNHSKVMLIRAGTERYAITGSGNFSFNAQIEQYAAWCDPRVYDFYRDHLERRCFTERQTNKRHRVWGEGSPADA